MGGTSRVAGEPRRGRGRRRRRQMHVFARYRSANLSGSRSISRSRPRDNNRGERRLHETTSSQRALGSRTWDSKPGQFPVAFRFIHRIIRRNCFPTCGAHRSLSSRLRPLRLGRAEREREREGGKRPVIRPLIHLTARQKTHSSGSTSRTAAPRVRSGGEGWRRNTKVTAAALGVHVVPARTFDIVERTGRRVHCLPCESASLVANNNNPRDGRKEKGTRARRLKSPRDLVEIEMLRFSRLGGSLSRIPRSSNFREPD